MCIDFNPGYAHIGFGFANIGYGFTNIGFCFAHAAIDSANIGFGLAQRWFEFPMFRAFIFGYWIQ